LSLFDKYAAAAHFSLSRNAAAFAIKYQAMNLLVFFNEEAEK
jgi:hypothetical protein